MKIKFITQEEHDMLVDAFNNYPHLVFKNDGYQYVDKSKFTEEDSAKFEEIKQLLSKSVYGFNSFLNLRPDAKGQPQIRLEYNYNWDGGMTFVGVGYLLVDELLNGFSEE